MKYTNRMRKRLSILCICMSMLMFVTGCGDKVVLTEEENNLIAEYAAGVMLKYSFENKWEYQKLNTDRNRYKGNGTGAGNQNNPLSPTTPNSPAATSPVGPNGQPITTAPATSAPGTSLVNALGMNGATIALTNTVVGKKYPLEDFAVSIPATPGNDLVACEFTIKNSTGSNITLNTKGAGVSMKLTVSGSSVNNYSSMLKNDLFSLTSVTLNSGSEYKAVVVFQVKEGAADSISGAMVNAVSSGKTIDTFNVE